MVGVGIRPAGGGGGRGLTYLDHAATSWPKPDAVGAAMLRAMEYAGGNPGRAGHLLSVRASETVYAARECAASFFGLSRPENVLFYPNATYAINAVLHGLALSGKEVLYSELEHNAVLRPLEALRREAGVTGVCYPVFGEGGKLLSDAQILAGIRARITRDTALVCACHASNVCTAMLPLARIGALCRAAGVPLLADVSQSAGAYDIRMERDGISYLCTAGHKGLLGPAGSGLLLIAPDAAMPRSFVQGGNGVHSLSPAMPDFLPEGLEAGTLSVPAIAGLAAGMETLCRIGTQAVRAREHEATQRLAEMLWSMPGVSVHGADGFGTVLSFSVRDVPCAVCAARLAEAGICVRAGFHCAPGVHRALGTELGGTVRVSPGWNTDASDTERFYRAMHEMLCGRLTASPCAAGQIKRQARNR